METKEQIQNNKVPMPSLGKNEKTLLCLQANIRKHVQITYEKGPN